VKAAVDGGVKAAGGYGGKQLVAGGWPVGGWAVTAGGCLLGEPVKIPILGVGRFAGVEPGIFCGIFYRLGCG
jgi:hypothetical protein